MRAQRQSTRSTKKIIRTATTTTTTVGEELKGGDVIIQVYDTADTLYTDQTGKFPVVSSRGNKYQMVLYHVGTNSIWVHPTKDKTEGEMKRARGHALGRMKACGIKATQRVLDNEASSAYKQAIKESTMSYKLVPPGDRHRNVAEKATQTWKDHFVAAISGTA